MCIRDRRKEGRVAVCRDGHGVGEVVPPSERALHREDLRPEVGGRRGGDGCQSAGAETGGAGVGAPAPPKEVGVVDLHPVSYTHLDVYKRQTFLP